MSKAVVGICTIELDLGGVDSLKLKHSILTGLFKRIRSQFNIATAEIDDQDRHESAVIAIVVVSNSSSHANSMINNVLNWIEANWKDGDIVDQQIEIV